MLKKNDNAVLLLIGVGEKEEEVRKQVNDLRISDKVRFLGNRSDVNELYQVMDAFVLPSFFEGIPVVGVEAQYAGLPCFFSDKVPKEVSVAQNCKFIGLNESAKTWSEIILENISIRKSCEEKILKSQYNIDIAYEKMIEYYERLAESIE